MMVFRRIICGLTIALMIGGCSQCSDEDATPIRTMADLKGKRCGIIVGSVMQEFLENLQDGIEYYAFNDALSMVEALRLRKIDVIPLDTSILRCWAANRPGELECILRFADNPYGYFFQKGSPLRSRVNAVLAKMKASGELQRIVDKWCEAPSLDEVRMEPDRSKDRRGRKGTLRFVTSADYEPSVFIRNGEIVGFDIDIVRCIAHELDMDVEFVCATMSAIVPMVQSGKADMGGGSVTITESRSQAVDFSDCYLNDGYSLLVRSARCHPDEEGGVLAGLKTSFVRTFVAEDRWKMLANGFGVTLVITFLAAIFGTALAFPVWWMRSSRVRSLAAFAKMYISLLQGTPVLVLLMVLYYIVFGKVNVDGVWIAVIGFGLNLSVYAGEMLRSGVEAVPRGQVEAALALGYTPRWAFCRFVLPQAVRAVLPVYRGELIGLLKMTSIVGYIAIGDLTKASDLVRSRTYESFFPIITTAVIYFVASWLLALALERLGRQLDPACVRAQKGDAK